MPTPDAHARSLFIGFNCYGVPFLLNWKTNYGVCEFILDNTIERSNVQWILVRTLPLCMITLREHRFLVIWKHKLIIVCPINQGDFHHIWSVLRMVVLIEIWDVRCFSSTAWSRRISKMALQDVELRLLYSWLQLILKNIRPFLSCHYHSIN